jgi:hypothetical protein
MGHGQGDIVSKEGPSQGAAYLSQVPLFFSFFLSGAQSLGTHLKAMEHGV